MEIILLPLVKTQPQVVIIPPHRAIAQAQLEIIPPHWEYIQRQVVHYLPLRVFAQPQVRIILPHRDITQLQVVIILSHREGTQPQVLVFQVFTMGYTITLGTLLVLHTQTTELFLTETLITLREELGREHRGQSLQHPQIRDVIRSSVMDFKIEQVVHIQVF